MIRNSTEQEKIYDNRVSSLQVGFSEIETFSLELINDIIKNHNIQTICDFGCGTGKYLNYICSNNPGLSGQGFDISKNSISIANSNKVQNSSFMQIDGTFNDLQGYASKFDLVIINHVFEHVHPEDRVSFLESAKNLLNTNGIIFISVPNRRAVPEVIVSLKEKLLDIEIRKKVGHEYMESEEGYLKYIKQSFVNYKINRQYDVSLSYQRLDLQLPLGLINLLIPWKFLNLISPKLSNYFRKIDLTLTKTLLRKASLSFYYTITKDKI